MMKTNLEAGCEVSSISEESKPDIACKNIYPALARALLYDLHANGMELLEEYLPKTSKPRTLVVVGPGPDVLPFSDNLDRVSKMLDGGNLVLMDYNKAICDKISAYLADKGFGQKFKIRQVCGDYDPRKAAGTAFIQVRNILDGYSFPGNSVSAIDMTVAVHHATQYESDILSICKEAYRVLAPGGVLHIGEGNVDMKHSERKLKKLGNDLLALGEKGVYVLDARYQDLPTRETCFGEDNYKNATVSINDKGMVKISGIKDSVQAVNCLQSVGYKQLYRHNGDIILPFIDHAIEEDFHDLIVPVREYYSAVKQTCLEKLAEDKHEAFLKAITKEQNDAERGLVEFYSHPDMLVNNLEKAGFEIVEKRYTDNGPFVNILARK